jgi:hypothetical protein
MSDFASIAAALGLGGLLGALARAGVDRATDFRNRMIGAADDFLEQVGSTRAALFAASGTLFDEAKLAAFVSDETDEARTADSATQEPTSSGETASEHKHRHEVLRKVERNLARYRERADLKSEDALKEIDSALAELRKGTPGATSSTADAEKTLAKARARLKLREAFESLGTIDAIIPRLEVIFPTRGRGASSAAEYARLIHDAVFEEWLSLEAALDGDEDAALERDDLEQARAAFTAEVNTAIRRWLI